MTTIRTKTASESKATSRKATKIMIGFLLACTNAAQFLALCLSPAQASDIITNCGMVNVVLVGL